MTDDEDDYLAAEFAPLFKFGVPWRCTEVKLVPPLDGNEAVFELCISDGNERRRFRFTRPRRMDGLHLLLSAEHYTIARMVGTQRQFGTIHLEFGTDCYQAIFCDEVAEVPVDD